MWKKEKKFAIAMRRQGKQYSYISQKLGISKSTLSDWFRDLEWSRLIKRELDRRNRELAKKNIKILIAVNKNRWLAWREEHRKQAIMEFRTLKKNALFVSGIMLYWAEGDNGNSANVRLTNTDPRMIRLFIRFAKTICKVKKEDIRICLILYPDLNDKNCKKYWSKYLEISETQFYKTQFIKGHHPTKRLEKGICMVKIGGTGLKEKIKTWIDLYSRD